MPVHPFDTSDNYWGYMPLVWGAVHRPYAAGDDAPGELAALVAAAHAHDIEVWLDVVFNHTGRRRPDEADAVACAASTMPTRTCTAPMAATTTTADAATCRIPADPNIQQLILTALDRFADLGIDGFRFDLASLLTRDGGGLVDRITEWACAPRRAADRRAMGPCRRTRSASGRIHGCNGTTASATMSAASCAASRVWCPAVIERLQGSPDLFPQGRRPASTSSPLTTG